MCTNLNYLTIKHGGGGFARALCCYCHCFDESDIVILHILYHDILLRRYIKCHRHDGRVLLKQRYLSMFLCLFCVVSQHVFLK